MVSKPPSFDEALAVLLDTTQVKRLKELARPSFGDWIPRTTLLSAALTDLFTKYERMGPAEREAWAASLAAAARAVGKRGQGRQGRLAQRFEYGRVDAPHTGEFGPLRCFELRAVDDADNCEYVLRQRRANGCDHYILMTREEARLFRDRQGGVKSRRRRLHELHPDKLGREQTPEEREEYARLAKQRKQG